MLGIKTAPVSIMRGNSSPFFMLLKKIPPLLILSLTFFAPAAVFAGWGTPPSVKLTVGSGTSDVQVASGSSLKISATASDPDGDMKEHWLEIQNPSGKWSWQGWLNVEPWLGSLSGNGSSSTKATTFTFNTAGTYAIRSTAIDAQSSDWSISNVIHVTVSAASSGSGSAPAPAPTPTPTPTPSAPAPSSAPVAPVTALTVGGGAADVTVVSGTKLNVTGTATDANGDLKEHWLEIQNPSGAWSWQGWLKVEPWLGGLVGSTSKSVKSTTYTFDQTGTYTLRTTAIDSRGGDWIVSNLVHVKVTAASTTPSTPSTPSTPPPSTTPPPVVSAPGSIFNADGSVNQTAYVNQLAVWTHDSVSQLLGPTFEQLNPNATDDRPTNFQPTSRQCSTSYVNKINPFELGPPGGCYPDSDYWSETGQVAYVPDDIANDPGLDRVQTFAYYNHVFALSPRLDWTGIPHPDAQTKESNYKAMLGFAPKNPVAMVRNYGMLSNEALVLYRDGLLGVAGTQTSREWWERPYPGLLFPPNKVPTSIALTTGNEFALVTIWDTQALKGQLAVVALEAKWLPFHTWPYMALPNQGSWSDMKLLGYLDLPMAAPSSVAAASNGWWSGPSQTANLVLSQIDLANDSVRAGIYSGDMQWTRVVANKGYAIVASKQDNRAVIVDLTPLFNYVRESWLSSGQNFRKTLSTRGSGAGQWPLTFAENPSMKPRVVWQKDLPKPTAVLAGLMLDRWSPDRHKAYVAREDGTIHIIDTSSLMARFSYEKNGALTEIGSLKVGRNPVSMAFARHIDYPLPLLPVRNGTPASPDVLNNQFYVACRGDREIDAVVTYDGQGTVYRRIRDRRMGDPVAVSVAGRGYIVSVADYAGRKLLSFRVGTMTSRDGKVYGPGADGKADYEFAGQLPFGGYPIAVNTANVN
ncbi:hypothetical protein DB347_02845 [Opitutaceae bacterium EW11]|nr:hypothetical protein DB347_02845 [Opitutaceae bacterium EW11]